MAFTDLGEYEITVRTDNNVIIWNNSVVIITMAKTTKKREPSCNNPELSFVTIPCILKLKGSSLMSGNMLTELDRVIIPYNNWGDRKVVTREQVTQQETAPVELLNDLWLFWAVPMHDSKPSLAEKRAASSKNLFFWDKYMYIKKKTVAKITLEFHWSKVFQWLIIKVLYKAKVLNVVCRTSWLSQRAGVSFLQNKHRFCLVFEI